jgi:phosphoribosylamine---glycine ligase
MHKKKRTVLIIGAGGREHALAWKVAQSPTVEQVWVAPGNAGTALEDKVSNIALKVDDVAGLLAFAQEQAVDLTIIGPEAALAAGVADAFQAAGLACFGPTREAAQLETSKVFSKQFMQQHHIPTARYAVFDHAAAALAYVRQQPLPLVIKADGLAAGKGVIIAETLPQAEAAVTAMLEEKIFGAAGQRIVIEEWIAGTEMSFIVMTDGQSILPLASSKDHKRRDDHDQGPNTGGMGAYSPAPQLTAALEQRIIDNIITPVVAAFAAAGTPYVGFLYAGLMMTPTGDAKVLEFNCRLGDPETQPILMRLQSDLVTLCLAATAGQLGAQQIQWDSRPALAVILAAAGYPGVSPTGDVIPHLDTPLPNSCKIFHAATKKINHDLVTNGGRVLAITALGDDLSAARHTAYALVKTVAWPGCHYRTDIGNS